MKKLINIESFTLWQSLGIVFTFIILAILSYYIWKAKGVLVYCGISCIIIGISLIILVFTDETL